MIVNGYKIEPNANLHRAYLEDEDLSGADLTGANLYRAELACSNLSGADLTRAYLYRAFLPSSNLSGAILSDANLEGADLGRANLAGADLRAADLSGATLVGADLRGADLRGANLYFTMLHGADLTGADLSGASLIGARFYCADLTGVVLSGDQLNQAILSGAIMPGPGAPPNYKNINTDKELQTLLAQVRDAEETYENTKDYDECEGLLDAAEELITLLYGCVGRALDIVRPQFDHRESVIAALEQVAYAAIRYTDPDSDYPLDEQCDDLIGSLDKAYTKIVDFQDTRSGKADVSDFLSEIGFKIDVEVEITPENRHKIIARLDQLASDVARLAGISKEETPSKTVLAAIEASNLTPEIMELVSDAVLDCADVGDR